MTPRLVYAAAVAWLLVCRSAPADTTTSAPAEALFRQGRASALAGDYAHACAAFAESLRLEPAPGALLNLADCEEHVGRVASAWRDFVRAEDAFPSGDERRPLCHDRAAALAPRVPWVTVALEADAPTDARVFWDDVELDAARLAAPMPVDPGSHRVLVVAPGRVSTASSVVATEHDTLRVIAAPGPLLRDDPAQPPPPRSRTAAWLVGAAGLASLGVGTYFGARALAERSTSDAACKASVCTSAGGLDAYSSARTDARIADVALGLGVVGLAVGGSCSSRPGARRRARRRGFGRGARGHVVSPLAFSVALVVASSGVACELVVDDGTRVLAAEDAGADTAADAGAMADEPAEAQPPDAPPSAESGATHDCTATCTSEAKSCQQACDATQEMCKSACPPKDPMCGSACSAADSSCKAGCSSQCAACVTQPGCAPSGGCAS